MTGRIDQGKDHYFCECGFSCRSVKIWNDHKKKCEKELENENEL